MSFFSQQDNAIVSEPSPQNLEQIHHEDLYKKLPQVEGDIESASFEQFLQSTAAYLQLQEVPPVSLDLMVSETVRISRFSAKELEDAMRSAQQTLGVFLVAGAQARPQLPVIDQFVQKSQQAQRGYAVQFCFQQDAARIALIDISQYESLQQQPQLLFEYVYGCVLLFFSACERTGCDSILLQLPQADEQLLLHHAICAALMQFKRFNASADVTLIPFGRQCEHLLRLVLPVYFPRNEKEVRMAVWQRGVPTPCAGEETADSCGLEAKTEAFLDDTKPTPADIMPQIQKMLQQQDIYEESFIARQQEQPEAQKMLERRAREQDLQRTMDMQVVQKYDFERECLLIVNAFKMASVKPTDNIFWELAAIALRFAGVDGTQPVRVIWCTGSPEMCLFIENYYYCFPERFRQRIQKVYLVRPQNAWKAQFTTPELYKLAGKIYAYQMLEEVRAELGSVVFSNEIVQWDSRFK